MRLLLSLAILAALSACAATSGVSTDVTDANLIVSALQPIAADIAAQQGVTAATIATIQGYVAQAQTDAAALAGSSATAPAFVSAVESVANALLPLANLPAADTVAIQAAEALLPVILSDVGLSAARAGAVAPAMDPATARLKLAAFTAR